MLGGNFALGFPPERCQLGRARSRSDCSSALPGGTPNSTGLWWRGELFSRIRSSGRDSVSGRLKPFPQIRLSEMIKSDSIGLIRFNLIRFDSVALLSLLCCETFESFAGLVLVEKSKKKKSRGEVYMEVHKDIKKCVPII